MQHLQLNTTLQGGKYRKLRVSERHKNIFLDVRAQASYSIERVQIGPSADWAVVNKINDKISK